MNSPGLALLETTLGEALFVRSRSNFYRVESQALPASPNASYWRKRGNGGWHRSVEESLVGLAFNIARHRDVISDAEIEVKVLRLVAAAPARLTARSIRGRAGALNGDIPCSKERADAAVARLVASGQLIRVECGDRRSMGRLKLAGHAIPESVPKLPNRNLTL